MKFTLAFDVYGTLIDPSGVRDLLKEMTGSGAGAFNKCWRDKQLEYSFRRGLMDAYTDFSACTRDALNYACEFTKHPLKDDQKAALLNQYTSLPAYPDVKTGLEKAVTAGHRCFAFSNGSTLAVAGLLEKAGIADRFEGIVSAEEVLTFKPNPKVYAHFCEKARCTSSEAVLISGNSFDVIGARHFGLKAVWIKRDIGDVFDPWGTSPNAIAGSLTEAVEKLSPG